MTLISIVGLTIKHDAAKQIISGLDDRIENFFPKQKKIRKKWKHADTRGREMKTSNIGLQEKMIEGMSKMKLSKRLLLKIFQKWEFEKWHMYLDWKVSECQI